jgi:hypothetical protein
MFLESIKFKREKDSEWERGYYIGKTDNSEMSVILDRNYKPVPRDAKGCDCWDYITDTDKWMQFRCEE